MIERSHDVCALKTANSVFSRRMEQRSTGLAEDLKETMAIYKPRERTRLVQKAAVPTVLPRRLERAWYEDMTAQLFTSLHRITFYVGVIYQWGMGLKPSSLLLA